MYLVFLILILSGRVTWDPVKSLGKKSNFPGFRGPVAVPKIAASILVKFKVAVSE